jgi:hypothetical protein
MSTRRVFLAQTGLGVAAAVAAALGAPVRGLARVVPPAALPPAALPGAPAVQADAGWEVDDMWGPRYAHPIPYQHHAAAPHLADVAPVDRNFLI